MTAITSKHMNARRRGRRFLTAALLAAAGLVSPGCVNNVLSETARRDTPAAVVFEAKKLLNERRYAEAVSALEGLSAADLAARPVAIVRASAYAGRCGLEFIELVSALRNVGASDSLFEILLSALKSATDHADCRVAEDIVESVGATLGARTIDENLLLAFISFAKIGAILAVDADVDGDGIADAGYNACSAAGGLDADQAGEIGTAIALAATSLQGVVGVADAVANDLAALCGSLAGACSITDPAGFSGPQLEAIRSVVHDGGSLGLGTQPGVVCP